MATTSKIPTTLPSYVGLLSICFGVFDFLMAQRLAEGLACRMGAYSGRRVYARS
jgi:hypothetical protein